LKYYIRLLKYLKPYWLIVVFTWLLSIFVVFLQAITVWIGAGFVQKILSSANVIQTHGDIRGIIKIMDRFSEIVLARETPFESLIVGSAVLIGTAFLTGVLRLFKLYILGIINQSVLLKIREELFHFTIRRDLLFSKTVNAGELTSLFIRDVDQLNSALIDAIDRIIMQPLRLMVVAVLMFSLSIELTLLVMFFLFCGGIIVYSAGNYIEKIWKQLMEKIAHTQAYLTEFLSLAALARSLGRENEEKSYYYQVCSEVKNLRIRQTMTQMFTPEIVKILLLAAGATLFIIGGFRVYISHTMTSDTLIKILMLLPMATLPMQALATLYTSIKSSMASVKRIFSFMDDTTYKERTSGSIPVEVFQNEVRMDNISVTYNNTEILHNINLSFPKNRITVISGQTGSGKTTLLGLIAGFIQPSAGCVCVDGVPLETIDEDSWMKHLGIVTQEPLLLNRSVRENLLYADPDAEEESLRDVLKKTLLWNDKPAFIDGLDTRVGIRGDLLSGGERQRLTIARTLLKKPDILLMDEPTSMLDYDSKMDIRDTIRSLASSYTIIMVSHDAELFKIADIHYHINTNGCVERV